jgi:hypothetical protein
MLCKKRNALHSIVEGVVSACLIPLPYPICQLAVDDYLFALVSEHAGKRASREQKA